MPKEYNANGLAREGALRFVNDEESLRSGLKCYPWPVELKAEMVEAMNGAYSRADLVERIAKLADAYAVGEWPPKSEAEPEPETAPEPDPEAEVEEALAEIGEDVNFDEIADEPLESVADK